MVFNTDSRSRQQQHFLSSTGASLPVSTFNSINRTIKKNQTKSDTADTNWVLALLQVCLAHWCHYELVPNHCKDICKWLWEIILWQHHWHRQMLQADAHHRTFCLVEAKLHALGRRFGGFSMANKIGTSWQWQWSGWNREVWTVTVQIVPCWNGRQTVWQGRHFQQP